MSIKHIFFSGWNYRANSQCGSSSQGGGDYISSYDTLQEAKDNCHGSCGCIRDHNCDGAPWYTYEGTRVVPSGQTGSCLLVSSK